MIIRIDNLASSIHTIIAVEIKQKRTRFFVIKFSSPVAFILSDDLAAILRNEVALFCSFMEACEY